MEKAWELLRKIAGEEIYKNLVSGKPVKIVIDGKTYRIYEKYGRVKVDNLTNGKRLCLDGADYGLPIADQYVYYIEWLLHDSKKIDEVAECRVYG